MVHGCLKIASGCFCGCLVLDLAQDRAEPGHVPVAAQVRDVLPAPFPYLREQDRDGVTAQLPAFFVAEPPGNDLRVQPVHRDRAPSGHRDSEIVVRVLDNGVSHEPLRNRPLKSGASVPGGQRRFSAGLLLDPLSICFALLITGVRSLILIFAVGYMGHDPERRRFFGYMNLFIVSMLLLVVADNYLALYAGWEGLGLASYLLIGFWQYKPSAAVAAKKAFIANRVGDAGLSLAIMLMFRTFGSVTFAGVFGAVHSASPGVVTALGLLLLGACGKSAQLPLQSWLLDAMEGPTPVSALIHAATMVTASVYLIVRSAPIFNLSGDARLVVAIVGAATLLFGAIIGCAKDG